MSFLIFIFSTSKDVHKFCNVNLNFFFVTVIASYQSGLFRFLYIYWIVCIYIHVPLFQFNSLKLFVLYSDMNFSSLFVFRIALVNFCWYLENFHLVKIVVLKSIAIKITEIVCLLLVLLVLFATDSAPATAVVVVNNK